MRQGKQEAQEDGQPPAPQVVMDDEADRMDRLHRLAGESGVSLLEECRHALAEVRGANELGLCPGLALELLGERRRLRGVEQALRLPDGAGRHRGEQLGHLGRAAAELRGGYDLGDEPPLQRLRCGEPPAGREPLEGPRGTEQPAGEPRPAGVGHEADADERGNEARLVRGDPHVAGEREREPRAGRGAVDDGEHRLLEPADRQHLLVEPVTEALGDVARAGLKLLQVLADAETAPGAGEHDRADRRVASLLERGGERSLGGAVQRVQNVRSVERDREDRSVAPALDFGHGGSLNAGATFSP